jgi:hypothetical protein
VKRAPKAIPTAERTLLGRPARRTTAVAVALAIALALAAAAVAQSARDLGTRQEGLVPRGDSLVVIVDLSLSIPPIYYKRMRSVLESISSSGGSVGLIIFSDTAYELFPPGTPAVETRPVLRFLEPAERPPEVFQDDRPYYLPDPWSESFRSGTRISGALNLARDIVVRDQVDASVLLVSDLHSSEDDRRPLQAALRGLEEAQIPLRVVPLFPLAENREFFASHGGPDVFADWRRFVESGDAGRVEAARVAVTSPVTLVLAAAVLLVLLGANEFWCRRLDLPEARGAV